MEALGIQQCGKCHRLIALTHLSGAVPLDLIDGKIGSKAMWDHMNRCGKNSIPWHEFCNFYPKEFQYAINQKWNNGQG